MTILTKTIISTSKYFFASNLVEDENLLYNNNNINEIKKESNIIVSNNVDDEPLNKADLNILKDFIANNPNNPMKEPISNFITMISDTENKELNLTNKMKNEILKELKTEYYNQLQIQKKREEEERKKLEEKKRRLELQREAEEKEAQRQRKLERIRLREEREAKKKNKRKQSDENPFLNNIVEKTTKIVSDDNSTFDNERIVTKQSKKSDIKNVKKVVKDTKDSNKKDNLRGLKNLLGGKVKSNKNNDSSGWNDI